MTGKTHLSGGLASGLLLAQVTALVGIALLPVTLTISIIGTDVPAVLAAVIALGFGSLLPDIDEPNSLVSNLPRASRGMVRQTLRKKGIEGIFRGGIEIILFFLNLVTRGLSSLIRMVAMGHRGATHWLITSVLLSILVGMMGFVLNDFPDLGFWFFIGYLSHLALDMMTISGLEVLQPFTDRKFHLLPPGFRIRTGSLVDVMMTMIFSLITGSLIFWYVADMTFALLP